MTRLLYGLISSLSTKEGFCWATNRFLADRFGVKQETISRAIKALADAEYIRLEYDGLGDENRRIYTIDNFVIPLGKNVNDPCEKSQATLDKIVKHIGTVNKRNINFPMFDSFWSAYPRKVAKQAALKAFKKLNPDEALLADMLAALDWQRTSDDWQRDGGKFIPYPATWLNGHRWEDDPPNKPEEPARPAVMCETYLDESGRRCARFVSAT